MSSIDLVKRLVKLVNDGDSAAATELFTPEAVVAIPALSPRSGHAEIRALFEFCAGIGVSWRLRNAVPSIAGFACEVDQSDGWSELLEVAPLHYERFDVTIDSELIAAIQATWSEATTAALGARLEGFTPWATRRHPELYTADGDFVYSRESGAGFVAAADEWLRRR